MIAFFRKPLAFLRKDFLNESSYKFAFVLQFFGLFLTAFSLFYLSKLVGPASSPYLNRYGGDYFSFVLIGIALAGYLQVSMGSFAKCIRDAQMLGTLEALLVTQTSAPMIILSSSMYSFLWTSFRVVIFLAIGVVVFGLDLTGGNLTGALLVLILTIVCFSSFGILSASFIMILKRGDPLGSLFSALSWLLGGVYYPVSILPNWAQKVAQLLPITHSLEGMRLALLQGSTFSQLLSNLIPLMVITMIMLPVSILCFSYAVRKAKEHGSLVHY